MRSKLLFLITLLTTLLLVASSAAENNATSSDQNSSLQNKQKDDKATKEMQKKNLVALLLERKNELDESLQQNNIWSKIYSNYQTYLSLKTEKESIESSINDLKDKKRLKEKDKKLLNQYEGTLSIIKGKLQPLEEYKQDPFREFLKPTPIEDVPSVDNPMQIITALSFKKKLRSEKDEYSARYISLMQIVDKFHEERKILQELIKLKPESKEHKEELLNVNTKLQTYEPVLEIFKTTKNVYTKKIDEIKLKLRGEIKKEMEKTVTIGGILLFFFALFLLGKFLAHRYMSDNDRFYMINKALNFTFVTLLVIIILFSYIENVSYMVTVLGFASAGIAIAMKDWFMSMMGWFVIVIGGTIHVGDRVKFVKDGVEYVGDIVDISMMRMTLHEDVTLTTYMKNRRGGRIIFIPNNYIFTDMIANYSHAGLKTVWDGIDFMVTFDSDISKATSIAKEVSRKYSKGYTDITRKQLNKLRSSYSIRNTNVEPRILSFIEPYGVNISVWYLTNAYATLTLRSTISQEIIERIQTEESVFLAFPTQSIYMDKDVRKPPLTPPEDIQLDGVQQ